MQLALRACGHVNQIVRSFLENTSILVYKHFIASFKQYLKNGIVARLNTYFNNYNLRIINDDVFLSDMSVIHLATDS